MTIQMFGQISYFTIIPRVFYCIAVWHNCSVSMFAESLLGKVASSNVVDYTKWQHLRHICIQLFQLTLSDQSKKP